MPFEGDVKQFEIPAPVVETDAQRVIREARALIQRGWTKGWERDTVTKLCFAYAKPTPIKTHAYCMVGALREAAGDLASSIAMEIPGASFVKAALPGVYRQHSIPSFNDARDTTHADVLAVFDRAYVLAGQSA